MSIRSMKLTVISSLLGEKKKYRASSVIIVGFSFTEGAMSIYSMRVLHKLMTYISQTCCSLILFVKELWERYNMCWVWHFTVENKLVSAVWWTKDKFLLNRPQTWLWHFGVAVVINQQIRYMCDEQIKNAQTSQLFNDKSQNERASC